MHDHGRGVIKGLMKRVGVFITMFYLLAMSVMIAGCGGGGGEGVSSQVVSGVAATGAPLAGEAKIKDSSTPVREKTTVIGNDGSFAFDVTDMSGPFPEQRALTSRRALLTVPPTTTLSQP